MPRTGRPKTQINKAEFEKLLQFGSTTRECAWWFECSNLTIERFVKREYHITFEELQAQKAIRIKIALKRKMVEKALAGDNTMLIWTSKNMLGWTDKIQEQVNQTITQDVVYDTKFAGEAPATSDAQPLPTP